VDQAELELQIKVWKNLAISKQVLMRTATDALKLDPDCSSDELRTALDAAIKKSINADITVEEAQEHAKLAVAVMEKKVTVSNKIQLTAEASAAKALEAKQLSEQAMATEREAHINELKKFKAQTAEKEKTIKAINKALADTPENVVKKLKTLKKQKFDEAESCKRAEAEVISLKKEKKLLDQNIEEMKASLETAGKVAEQQRELHTLCADLHSQLSGLVEDASTLPALPELDEKALETLEPKETDEKE